MFGFFKRKASEDERVQLSRILQKPEAILEMIDQMAPNELLMVLVGAVTVDPTMKAARAVMKEQGEVFEYGEFIDDMSERVSAASSEVMKRRLSWMQLGMVINAIGEQQSADHSTLIRIWSLLLPSVQFARDALRHMVIWQDEEKRVFVADAPRTSAYVVWKNCAPLSIRDSKELMSVVLNLSDWDSPPGQP